MYTLGTSAIKYLTAHTVPPISVVLDSKLAAFVGTPTDKNNTKAEGTLTAFIEVSADSSNPTKIQWPITGPVTLYQNVNSIWVSVGQFTSDIYPVLASASGYGDAIYALQRGNFADMESARKIDGVPFYSRDTRELYIYDATVTHSWQLISKFESENFIIGMIMTWPEVLGDPPYGWIRTEGQQVEKLTYMDLFQVCGTKFGPQTTYLFTLPNQSNGIIRWKL
jgi:hypothetical protein